MSEVSSPKLPAVFGRYLLLQRLSRGGMGEIYLAKLGEIQGFEKPIVIKKILPQLAQDAEFLRRFIAEAQIAIKLTHANIVPVYEVGMVDGEYFLGRKNLCTMLPGTVQKSLSTNVARCMSVCVCCNTCCCY